MVDGWIAAGRRPADFVDRPDFTGFKAQAAELAARDMQGHLILKERGTDGDLKCILRGISEDMPKKVAAVEAATTPAERARGPGRTGLSAERQRRGHHRAAAAGGLSSRSGPGRLRYFTEQP